jgi:hypothetical protein
MASIAQNTVRVLAGESAYSSLSPADARVVADTIEQRMLLALCMTEAPTDEPELGLWNQLLASAIVAFSSLDYDGIQSEHVRNYSYTMSQNAGTWNKLRDAAGDLLLHFNECGQNGISMQTDLTWIQYTKLGDCLRFPVGGAL